MVIFLALMFLQVPLRITSDYHPRRSLNQTTNIMYTNKQKLGLAVYAISPVP